MSCNSAHTCESRIESFFEHNSAGDFIPRTILIDSDPSVQQYLRSKKNYFNIPSQYCVYSSKGNDMNYSKGRIDQETLEISVEACRKMLESCENFQAFQIFHSLGGGTGSGLMEVLLEHLAESYPKKERVAFSCCPSNKISELPLETINACFRFISLTEYIHISLILDNELFLIGL